VAAALYDWVVGLGWAGLGWVGLGWVGSLGCAGLGWAVLGLAGRGGVPASVLGGRPVRPANVCLPYLCLLQHKLQGFDLWSTSFSVLKGSLVSAAQLLADFATEASTLTSDWAMGVDSGGHLWQGPAFSDQHLVAFQDRIEQVGACAVVGCHRSWSATVLAGDAFSKPQLMWHRLTGISSSSRYDFTWNDCSLHVFLCLLPDSQHCLAITPSTPFGQIYGLRELQEELGALFSQDEAAALGLSAVLAPFARLPALHVSTYTASAWKSAHNEHERRLEAIEERVSQKLKELFGECVMYGATQGWAQHCCMLRHWWYSQQLNMRIQVLDGVSMCVSIKFSQSMSHR